MNVVTDTHPLAWYLGGSSRHLSARARRVFSDAEARRGTVHIPSVVLMELSMLEQLGRIRMSYAALREQLGARPGFQLEPLSAEDVDEARSLGELRDPFDRMIGGTAIRLGFPLMTRDAALTASPQVRTIW
jgi:PIN domain nuclease of toxin-antitoxin system